MPWIPHPTALEGQMIKLEPLRASHIPELIKAGSNSAIWEFLPINGADPQALETELKNAVLMRAQGTQYPFAIVDKATGKVVGSTRLFDLFPEHRKLEIGWTWYAKEVWGLGLNIDCKLQLLSFCFEVMKLQRVQLKTRVTNLRSRAAILKIGATEEGIMRKDRLLPNGESRDTVLYSFIDEEWNEVKSRLETMLMR